MKRILITGANSYIGTSFESFVKNNEIDFEINTLDLLDPSWKEHDFSRYDSIFHVAAVVHKKEKQVPYSKYKKVNSDLAFEVAQIAKEAGVKQFVFLSTMSVYGLEEGMITKDTPINPKTKYGQSKYEAEIRILGLESVSFKIAIVRPPMVYGKNCTGNFTKLTNFVKKYGIFIKIENQRSMIHIDHLSHFISELIQSQIGGIFFPQNKEYVSTYILVKESASLFNKNLIILPLPFSQYIINKVTVFKKVFGSLTYEKSMSILNVPERPEINYSHLSFSESLKESI